MTSKDWVDPIESSARELLKKRLGRMPELRALSPDEAFEVVTAAERLAANEQDVSLYEKATSPRYVFLFAVLLLLASVLGFVLFWGTAFAVGKLNLGQRAGGRAYDRAGDRRFPSLREAVSRKNSAPYATLRSQSAEDP